MPRPIKYEQVIPEEFAFEPAMGELRELVDEEIAGVQERHGDILDWDKEADTNMPYIWQVCDAIACTIARPGERQQAAEAGYRGFQFGAQLAERLSMAGYTTSLQEYAHDDERGMYGGICEDTQEYLGTRPQIDSYIGMRMPEIDPSSRYNDFAETMAAYVIMCAERDVALQSAVAESDDITPEEFERK